MLRYARFPATRMFAVEVSGWDSSQSFFVEKCDLVWNEESGKHVALRRVLRENTLLFVRLLQSAEADRSHTVVYQAELMGTTDSGLGQFRLHAVSPRLKEAEGSMA